MKISTVFSTGRCVRCIRKWFWNNRESQWYQYKRAGSLVFKWEC